MRNAKILVPTVLFPLIMLSLVIVIVLTSPEPAGPIIMSQIACLPESSDKITVVLQPTSKAIPDKVYNIEVRKGDVLRVTSSVSWTQQELEAEQAKGFRFPTTTEEFQFYAMDRNQLGSAWKNLSNEFTVGIYSEDSLQIVEYVPGTDSFSNWRIVLISLVGLILLIVYIRIRVSYAARIAREKAERESKEKAERESREREAKVNECPKCHKPWAREEVSSEYVRTELETDIATRHATDFSRNSKGLITGTTERTEHIPVTYSTAIYRYYYRCKYCGHTWTSDERQ